MAGATEFPGEVLVPIRRVAEEGPGSTRAALSRLVCQWPNWRQPNGRSGEMSCRLALRKAAEQRLLTLQAPSAPRRPRKPIERTAVLTKHEDVQCELKELGLPDLVVVCVAMTRSNRA